MFRKSLELIHINNYLVLVVLFFVVSVVTAQENPVLKFDKKGKFKIVQFTDVHLKVQNKPRCDSVMNTIYVVLAKEKPDMVILTGDLVTSEDVKLAWSTVTKPMREAKIPWAVVFGNHDHEHGYTNKQMMDYIVTLPFNLSQNGPTNISGSGNYILEVHGSKSNDTKAILYCIDSNAYTGEKDNPELGDYDWIKNDQIQWYRQKSEEYTKLNRGQPLPAMAFFHIPLSEYNVVRSFSNTIGDKDEEVASPVINSGMYNAINDSKDIMAVFCGHDHNNNFIGTLNNICLAYGCKTGKDSYGRLDKGGRVIELYEGARKFDTWLTTINETKKYFVTYPDSFKK